MGDIARRLRDHETCVPHGHVEPDVERWERDQAAALARSGGPRHPPVPAIPGGADVSDPLAPARGILVGLALSVPIWLGIAALVRWALR